MIVSINKDTIFTLFGADNFQSLEKAIDNMAPSLVEYHLANFCSNDDESLYFNKRDIENSFCIGEYSLYLDYSKNLYLELDESLIDNSNQSFW